MNETDNKTRDELFVWMDNHADWGDERGGGKITYGALRLLRRLLEVAETERDALRDGLKLIAISVEAFASKSARADRVIEVAKSHRELIVSCSHMTGAADSILIPDSARRLDEAIAEYDSNVKSV